MDLYDILEIKSNATEIEIKKAYFKLAKQYHPDKNKEDTTTKFQQIHSAYEILINNTTRQEYLKLNVNDKFSFNEVLEKIINNNFNYDEIKKYFKYLNKSDYDYIHDNFCNYIKSINITDLINIFTKKIINKNINISTETESEIDLIDNILYFYKLPFSLQKINKLDIKLELLININDINNKKKIKIKRSINNELVTSTLIFNLSHPYVIFNNHGDVLNDDNGNLIIKLNILHNVYWDAGIILFEKSMTLYQMIYGLDLFYELGDEKIIDIKNWIPFRDGNFIDLNNFNINILNYNLAIKLYLDYETNDEKEDILKKYFS